MNDVIEFEPMAAPLFFVQLREEPGGTILDGSAVELMISVSITNPAICVPLISVYDAVRNGFNVDFNELADVLQPRVTYKCFIYVKYDVRWIASGEIRIKPKVGCVWQPSL